jgi:hypothetical protein
MVPKLAAEFSNKFVPHSDKCMEDARYGGAPDFGTVYACGKARG